MRKRRFFLLPLIGLLAACTLGSSHPTLDPLVSGFLASCAKADYIYRNQFGKSFKIINVKNVSDRETVVQIEIPCGEKPCREEFTFRVLQAELFLTDEYASDGVSGLARIEWTYGLLKNAGTLPGAGRGMEQYFALSSKDGKWTSPKDDAGIGPMFKSVKSSWTKDKKGKHEIMQ